MAAPEDYNDPFEFRCRFSLAAPRRRKIEVLKSKFIEMKGLEENEAGRQAELVTDPGPLSDAGFDARMERTMGTEELRRSTGVLSLTELDRHPLM